MEHGQADPRLTKASIQHVHENIQSAKSGESRWQPNTDYEDRDTMELLDKSPVYSGDYWTVVEHPDPYLGLRKHFVVVPAHRKLMLGEIVELDPKGVIDELLTTYRHIQARYEVLGGSIIGIPTLNPKNIDGASSGFAFHILAPEEPGIDTSRMNMKLFNRETAVRIPTTSRNGRRWIASNKGVKKYEDDKNDELYKLK